MRKRVKVTNKGTCQVGIFCRNCGVDYIMTGFSKEQHDRLWNRDETKELIQDILPEVAPEWRELFKSHTCPKCWKKMLGL